jgi:hypothetical protein
MVIIIRRSWITQDEEIKLIKQAINRALNAQPIELNKYRDLIEGDLKYLLGKNVEYYFDEPSPWRRITYIDIDDEISINFYRTDSIDEIKIEDEYSTKYYNIFIEGDIMEVRTPKGSTYIMMNRKLKDVKPRE